LLVTSIWEVLITASLAVHSSPFIEASPVLVVGCCLSCSSFGRSLLDKRLVVASSIFHPFFISIQTAEAIASLTCITLLYSSKSAHCGLHTTLGGHRCIISLKRLGSDYDRGLSRVSHPGTNNSTYSLSLCLSLHGWVHHSSLRPHHNRKRERKKTCTLNNLRPPAELSHKITAPSISSL
jgi:hypothetical protein